MNECRQCGRERAEPAAHCIQCLADTRLMPAKDIQAMLTRLRAHDLEAQEQKANDH